MGKGKIEKGKEKMEKGKVKEKALDILAGSDDDTDGSVDDLSKIQINEDYARRFEHNKRRELQQRLEERKKRGLVADSDDEEESSEEDDDEEDEDVIASRRVDRRVFEVIRRIRSGDPRILDKDAKVYSSSSESEEKEEPKQRKVKEKPLYLKDVNARHLLEEGPEFGEQPTRSSKYDRIAYDEQQKVGLQAFLEAQKEVLGDDDEDEDDFFHEKSKGVAGVEEEEDDEEEKQTKELAGEIFGKDEELDENDKFLKDYFLKRPYLEKENKSYLDDIQELSSEEDLEKQEQYETAYNFRHQEVVAAGDVVPDRVLGHSRVVEGSVRKKESSRKQQRKNKEERIARAKQEQAEEIKQLKNLKKKEIAEKLERIRMIAGIGEDAACKLGADDLEEDFDPEDYDKKMQEMFNDSYYEADDVDSKFGSEEMDLDKPDFDKEDELLGLPKGWALGESKEESSAAGEKATKVKKISLKEKVELEKEMEEYYKLDYEDTIGDLKTRFKYKQVQPNNFGLNTLEILQSDDRDLNQYVSMKKLAPYREKEWEVTRHKMLSKEKILGGQKKEGKVKTGKKSKSEEGPSSSGPEKQLTNEQMKEGKVQTGKKSKSEEGPISSGPEKQLMNREKESDAKMKSTRSERRKRRKEDLKMTADRLAVYGKIKRQKKSH